MWGVAACGLAVLLSDMVLWLALWAGLVLLECSSCGGLAGLWAFGAVKWALLQSVTRLLTEGKPQCVLHRLVALLCLLPPVFESGWMLLGRPSETHGGPLPEPGMMVLALIASSLACVLWEMVFSSDGGVRKDNNKPNARALLMRVLKYFRPDSFYLVAAFGFLILGVICDTFIPFYQGKVIDMLSAQTLQTSFFHAIGQLALVSLGSSVFSGLRGSMFMWTLSRLNRRMKHLLFQSLLQQDIHFFEENKPGSLSSRLHSDVDRMGRTVALNANVLVRSTVKTSLMLVLMLGLSWELTVLTCIEMPLLALMQNKYIKYNQELKNQVQDCHAQTKDLAFQTIEGIQTVRSFNAEKHEAKRYNDALEQLCNVKTRAGIYSAVFLLVRRLVTVGIKVLMLLQARSLLSAGQLSIGSLLTFILYQKPMSANMKEILFGVGDMVSTVGVISKVFNYLDRKPKCEEAGELAPDKLEGRITFRNVTFAYPSAPDKPALKLVSMELRPGKVTALVGPSGSGKTSCVSLLKRLYEPLEGQILLDGQPLHSYKHKYLHQKMALVSQNPVLFSGSVRYNIEYGLKDCTLEKVEETARKTAADGFISKLESGYDTDAGERGGKLAVGLKQCIAIVRALVREPQIIILDEATSNLDVDIQHAVVREVLACGETVLVVAHQLKTVEKADHIIFMENGEVKEEGTHQELMAMTGRYHRLKEELFT
ncbi:antigen peptide transporter 2 [Centroberyx affinis]|uniref:antigen peptide transporter 2 n=1 Tax=Centroberyx affinis TaxID=166261 RepID=UPI003A5BE6CE